MKTTLCAVALACSMALGSQHASADVLRDFAQKELERAKARVADPEKDGEKAAANAMLFRFQLDVTGDGQPEIFLGSSVGAERNVSWSVYRQENGAMTRMVDRVMLDPRGFHVMETRQGLELLDYSRYPNGRYGLYSYVFTPDGQVLDQGGPLSAEEEAVFLDPKLKREQFGVKVLQKIEKIGAKDLLDDTNARWSPYDVNEGPYGQKGWGKPYVTEAPAATEPSPTPGPATVAAAQPAKSPSQAPAQATAEQMALPQPAPPAKLMNLPMQVAALLGLGIVVIAAIFLSRRRTA